MKWNKCNKRLLFNSLESPRKLRFGASCLYVPLTKTICAKLYNRRQARNRTYDLQQHAAVYDLAPKVGEQFDVSLLFVDRLDEWCVSTHRMYGYLSQRARMTGRFISEDDEWYMRESLRDIGINHCDLHSSNVGYINGFMVCIDFDAYSCKKTSSFRRKAG